MSLRDLIRYRDRPNLVWAKLIPVLLLAGCTAAPPLPLDQAFPELAQKTFSAGMTHISQKYIEPVDVSELALEGLRGLDSIDPSFQVEVQSGKLLVYSNALGQRKYILPAANNADAWASLMVAVLQHARSGASPISQAKEDKLIEAVFDGSVSLLDAFSRYSGAEKASENRAKRSGFGGIGIRVEPEDTGARIAEVFPLTPAEGAGLRQDDLITKVDNHSLIGLSKSKMRSALRGEIGSFIVLTIQRQNLVPFTLSVKRERILLPTVTISRNKGVLHAKVSSFNNETARQLATKIQSALKSNGTRIKGMILDLRNNPGGVLTQAVKLADLFLIRGKILSTHGRHPSSRHEYEARGNDILNGLPLVVLINGRSASASEIVAAALQDQRRAIVVGTSSYGKGSVQTVTRLPNDGELTLTWSRFVTPSGYILHKLGVPPFVCTGNTSGDPQQAIARTLERLSELSDVMNAWRRVETKDREARTTLRAACPSNPHQKIVDVQVANTLIVDPGLYSRVQGISPSIASAVK